MEVTIPVLTPAVLRAIRLPLGIKYRFETAVPFLFVCCTKQGAYSCAVVSQWFPGGNACLRSPETRENDCPIVGICFQSFLSSCKIPYPTYNHWFTRSLQTARKPWFFAEPCWMACWRNRKGVAKPRAQAWQVGPREPLGPGSTQSP